MLVVAGEADLRLGVVFGGGLAGPVDGAVVVFFGVVVHDAHLGFGVAFFGEGEVGGEDGFDADAVVFAQEGEVVAGGGVAGFGGFAQPVGGLDAVGVGAHAVLHAAAELECGFGVAGFGGGL